MVAERRKLQPSDPLRDPRLDGWGRGVGAACVRGKRQQGALCLDIDRGSPGGRARHMPEFAERAG